MTAFWRLSPVTLWVLALCGLVELTLTLADFRIVVEIFRLRQTAFEFAGFWPGLLRDWAPNYLGQPVLMFLTYSFLHVGPSHFLSNMASLIYLDIVGMQHFGTRRYAAIYVASIFGGAVGYGLLARGLVPMVGASGAIFGLAGAIVAWDYLDRRRDMASLWPVLAMIGYLAGLNLLLWYVMDGHLAWETHLGGAVAGGLCAVWFYRPPVSD